MCVCVSVRVFPFISVLNELVGCLVSYVCVIFLGMVGSENLVMVSGYLLLACVIFEYFLCLTCVAFVIFYLIRKYDVV